MAVTQLQIYNDALRIIGERKLANITENREVRHRLDDVYDYGAIDFCLEITKPRFASVVDKITTFTTSTEHGYNNVFTVPADYIALVGLFSDSKLDEPITRFIAQGDTIATDHSTIYLRYTSSTTGADFSLWTPSFAKVISAYLAKEVAPRIRPDAAAAATANFESERGAFLTTDASEESRPRSKPVTATLTNDWLQIYNDALFLLGQEQIISVNDDSNRRSVLDSALSQSTVEFHLEDTAWHWAITSTRIQYNPSYAPEWGYRRVFDKPDDLLRIDGLFYDEYFNQPLKQYADEGDKFYAEVDTMFLKYVPRTTLSQPTAWPAYFRKVISAELALAASGPLQSDPTRAMMALSDRVNSAKSNDAMQSPPRKITEGNWVRSRYNTANRRNRP